MYKFQRIRVLQMNQLQQFLADDASHFFHNSTISFEFAEELCKQSPTKEQVSINYILGGKKALKITKLMEHISDTRK